MPWLRRVQPVETGAADLGPAGIRRAGLEACHPVEAEVQRAARTETAADDPGTAAGLRIAVAMDVVAAVLEAMAVMVVVP